MRLAGSLLALSLSQFAKASTADVNATSADDGELICHTENPADCYPKLFRATDEFQRVRDDQDLPKGLHVRLNVGTGEKEAKINDPNEKNPELEGLPSEGDIVVVEREDAEEEEPLPLKPPAYDPVGKVKEPKQKSKMVFEGLDIIKAGIPEPGLFSSRKFNETAYDEALENVEELAHDVYYGLKMAEDPELMKTLLCLQSSRDTIITNQSEKVDSRAQKAAAIVAAAIQNNPSALQELEKSWPDLVKSACPDEADVLEHAVFNRLVRPGNSIEGEARDPSPAVLRARLSAINGLIRSEVIRTHFLSTDAMRQVLRLFFLPEDQYGAVHEKAAHLITDNFLDEGMGATLGLWPKFKPKSASGCRAEIAQADASRGVSETCWDAYVDGVAKRHKRDEGHWSLELSRLLKEGRRRAVSEGKVEL